MLVDERNSLVMRLPCSSFCAEIWFCVSDSQPCQTNHLGFMDEEASKPFPKLFGSVDQETAAFFA